MKSAVHKLLLISAILICQLMPGGAQSSKQILTGHVRTAVREGTAKAIGQMPSAGRMNLSIVLPLRNQDQLKFLLARLYDPSDAQYRKFLTVEEFTDQFGPTAEDYQSAVRFARANGMTVTGTPANRLIVPVSATVDQVQRAFHVSMKVYQHPTENRTFFSTDREPELPEGVSFAHIAGLNNFSMPRPMHSKPDLTLTSSAQVEGSGPGATYLGADMRAAYYGGTALTGSGQVVGLAQFDGYDPNDVALTFSNSGQTSAVPVNNVLLDGASGGPCQFNPFPCEDAEQVLDIVQAAEMAPGLSQIRVYIGTLDSDILNAMASENVASQLSISWTWNPDDPVTDDVFFEEFAAQGQTLFVASGDDGAFSANVADLFYPAEDPYVTAVGGTSLVTNAPLGPWVSETAWDHSGGGISPDNLPIPSWQSGVATSANLGSTTLRNIPDVAMEADFDNYDCNIGVCQGGWGGTSFASPRWAGFAALINQQAAQSGDSPIGFLNPALYAIAQGKLYATTFHDITSGENDNGGSDPAPYQIFSAVTGYDLVTGWGSPTGQSLIDALAPKNISGFGLSSSPAQLTIAPGDSDSATISINPGAGFSGAVTLALTGLPDGASSTWSENPATTSSQLTIQVPDTALRGSYLVKITGTSGSETATTAFALVVNAAGFSVLPSNSKLVVRPGLAAGTQIAVSRYQGFTSPVSLAITSPLPAGVTAEWSGNPAQDGALLTLSATSSAPQATTMLAITATSGNLTATTTVAVQVAQGQFWLNVAPPPANLTPGGQVTAVVTMLPLGNFNEPAALTASQLPAGVTATFSPTTVAPGQSSVMTLAASANAALGNYISEAVGTAADAGGNFTLQYSITATPVPSFNFVPTPGEVNVQLGQSTVVTVTTAAVNGFSGTIGMFGIPQLPKGMTFAYSPASFNAGGSTQLTLTAGPDTLPGNYSLGIGGQSGTFGTGVALYLNVLPATSLSLGLSPSALNLPQGQSATMTATLTSSTGSIESPTYSVVSGLPDGLSASFSAGQTAGTGVLTITPSYSVAAGTYTLNIAATSGTETVNDSMTVTITKVVGTFTAAATAVTVSPGKSSQSTITVSSINGYAGTVALSCSITTSPAGAQDSPTCTAGPSVTMQSGVASATTTVTLATTAATTSSLVRPAIRQPQSPWGGAGSGLVLAGLLWMFAPGARKRFRSLGTIVLLMAAMGGMLLSGCGGAGSGSTTSSLPPKTNSGTTAGAYTITVTATGNDAQNTLSKATFTLTVE